MRRTFLIHLLRKFGLVAAFAALLCAPAFAAKVNFVKLKVEQGCLAYFQYEGPQVSEYKKVTATYDGSGCEKDKLLNGSGKITFILNGNILNGHEGDFINGVPHGEARQTSFKGQDEYTVHFTGGCSSLDLREGNCTPFPGGKSPPPPSDISEQAENESAGTSRFRIDIPTQSAQLAAQPFTTPRRFALSLSTGRTLQGSSNLDCVVFNPAEGANARSALVNRCGSEVRLNYCLQQLSGADNCSPMSVGHEATMWPLRAGASLTLPAADTLKLWSVFACPSPTFPMQAKFKGGMLADGICAEDNLEPPPAQPGEVLRIVRSDDPGTWPPAWANKQCFRLSPRLGSYQTVILRNACEQSLNVYWCLAPNGSRLTNEPCMDRPIVTETGLSPMRPSDEKAIGKPNTYRSMHVFACDAPLIPAEIGWDGTQLSGTCKMP